MAILGIDLGTSNTLVAKLNSSGEPEILEIGDDRLVPSVIYMEELEGGAVG
jgi:molecular chaperone DnaK (HSP70)